MKYKGYTITLYHPNYGVVEGKIVGFKKSKLLLKVQGEFANFLIGRDHWVPVKLTPPLQEQDVVEDDHLLPPLEEVDSLPDIAAI